MASSIAAAAAIPVSAALAGDRSSSLRIAKRELRDLRAARAPGGGGEKNNAAKLRRRLPAVVKCAAGRPAMQVRAAAAAAGAIREREAEKDTFSKNSGYTFRAAGDDEELFTEYNVEVMAKAFGRRPFLLLRRVIHLGTTLGRWAALRYLDSRFGRSRTMFKKRAAELRAALVQLGPAYVKIAQAVSSRQDVISPEYVEEMELLQDRIAPFSTELAISIIEEDLAVPVEAIFSEISPEPIAAASLGQVYQARLRSNGEAVAVKVQRPGVRAAISLDIYILRGLAALFGRTLKLNTNLESIVDEWATSLFKEMDYRNEARNGKRFRKLFGSLPDVVVPEFYSELTSRRVLIMQWLEGRRLADVSDLHLVEVGVNCSLAQLLDYGFYHADPHPGNLMRTPDGKLAYIDFGMMGEVREDYRNALIEAALHLINREFDALADDFVTLGLLPASNNAAEVSNALTGVFQNAVSKGVRNISFGDLSGNLGATMYQYKFQLPSYFSLVVRSLTVLEGIALSVDPDYKVLSSSYPWIARKVLSGDSTQLRSTLQSLLYKDGTFRMDRLESLLSEAMRNALSDPENTTKADAAKERALLKRGFNFALGNQGTFVRELVLNELAKGADALYRAAIVAAIESSSSRLPFDLAVPSQFVEDEDLQSLSNLRRLSLLLPGGSGSDSNSGEEYAISGRSGATTALAQLELSDVFNKLTSSLKYLPLLSIFPELSFPAQSNALLLPLDFTGRLVSRALARAMRSTVPGDMSR